MAVTHTPGPWRVKRNPVTVAILGPNGEYVTENLRELPNQDANTRLVAAAPELLAACKGAVEEFSEWEGPEEDVRPGQYGAASRARNQAVRAYEAIRAAVAKAEGRDA